MSDHQLRQDDSYEVVIIAFLVVGILFFASQFLTPYFEALWFYTVQAEAHLAKLYSFGGLEDRTDDVIAFLSQRTPSTISDLEKLNIEERYLKILWHRYAFFIVLLFMAYKIHVKRSAYTGKPTLESLLKTEHKIWPALEFVKRFDPTTQFAELKGIGRYQERPLIFAGNSKIIDDYVNSVRKSKKERVYNEEVARKVFVDQLGLQVSSFMELPAMAKAAITLAVAKDLPDYFTTKNIYGERTAAYNELLRIFSIELSKTGTKRKEVDRFLDEFTEPLMLLLDGKTWHISMKEMLKNKDFNAMCGRVFGSRDPGETRLKEIRQFSRASFEFSSVVKTEFPMMAKLVNAVCEQHVDDSFNFRIARKTTYTAFRELILQHAFSNTLITRASFLAKRNGKFPAGRLVCFRPWDRTIFFALSNPLKYVEDVSTIDKQLSFPCESLGLMSHFYHELNNGSRIKNPFVDRAVRGLHQKLVEQNVLADT